MKKKSAEDRFAISSGKNNKPIIMEVVGRKGVKVAELVDIGDDKLPYHQLEESYVN